MSNPIRGATRPAAPAALVALAAAVLVFPDAGRAQSDAVPTPQRSFTVFPETVTAPEPGTEPLLPSQLEEWRERNNQVPNPSPEGRRCPVDPDVRAERVVPTSPEQPVPGDSRAATVTVFRAHRMTDAETNDATSTQTGEPSIGMNGRVVWNTGNWHAAMSQDYAQSYAYVSPYTNFPNDGGGFCCDQVVQYDRSRNLMIWYLQYGSQIRIAVSVGQAAQVGNVWTYYTLNAPFFGYPASNNLDFPDMSIGLNHLYVTSNVTNSSGNTIGAVCWRMPLDDLRAQGGANVTYFTESLPNLRSTQGAAGGDMFIGTQVNTSNLRIYRWRNDGTLDSVDRGVTSWFQGSSAPDPGGVDWISRDFNDILAAYVSGPNCVFMWDSAQGGGFAMPNIRVARFATSNRNLVDQGQIWSSTVAWAYPGFHPNDRGHVGGVMCYGGGGNYATLCAAVADDLGGSQIGPIDVAAIQAGTASPTGARWGDYYTGRRAEPDGNTWIGTGYVVRTDEPGTRSVPYAAWFGRSRDTPPANRTIRVNWAWGGFREQGTTSFPYSSVGEGSFATVPGDVVLIQAGSYNETPLLNRAATFQGTGGNVIIGQ